jgi:hypothetical protein
MTSKKNKAQGLFVTGLIVALLIAFVAHNRTATPVADSPAENTEGAPALIPTVQPPGPTPLTNAAVTSDPTVTAQIQVLEEILTSKNDNDPRLDRELKVLSSSAKTQLRAIYNSLSPEKRNERGLIVFLLGRNLTESADFEFLKSVVLEAPCLSLADCAKAASGGDEHAGGMGAALAYPQLVVLQALEKNILPNEDSKFSGDALEIVKMAQKSNVPEISQKARTLEK